MKTIKVSEATGAALDWLVAKCKGLAPFIKEPYDGNSYTHGGRRFLQRYSTDWSQGGPIIERERVDLSSDSNDGVDTEHRHVNGEDVEVVVSVPTVVTWTAYKTYGQHTQHGSTPLVAAMRCFVASKLGDTVEVPEELT
jgi:hypothetical protein